MALATDFREKRDEIRAKRVALKSLYDEREKTTDETKVAEKSDAIKSANLELSALVDKFEPIQEQYTAWQENESALKALGDRRQIDPTDDNESVNRSKSPADDVLSQGIKSIGDLLRSGMDARGVQNLKSFRGDLGELAIKTLITSADLTPLEDRRAAIVPSAQEERTTADLMLQGTTTAQKVTYFEETTFTNSAAETAEG